MDISIYSRKWAEGILSDAQEKGLVDNYMFDMFGVAIYRRGFKHAFVVNHQSPIRRNQEREKLMRFFATVIPGFEIPKEKKVGRKKKEENATKEMAELEPDGPIVPRIGDEKEIPPIEPPKESDGSGNTEPQPGPVAKRKKGKRIPPPVKPPEEES